MTHIFDPGGDIWSPSLEYVRMKTDWASRHLNAAERMLSTWVCSKPYKIFEKDDPDRQKHIFSITTEPAPEEIALIVGDFINCLRASLDQLAWNLVHLFPHTKPTDERISKRVTFPICESDEAYANKIQLFDRSIHPVMRELQPGERKNALRTHELWQLDKLWNIDKHRTIPVNCGNWTVGYDDETEGWAYHDVVNERFVVAVPCQARISARPRYVKPKVVPDILFGEYMGEFAVDIRQLRRIYKFVVGEVVPKFVPFFTRSAPLEHGR